VELYVGRVLVLLIIVGQELAASVVESQKTDQQLSANLLSAHPAPLPSQAQESK